MVPVRIFLGVISSTLTNEKSLRRRLATFYVNCHHRNIVIQVFSRASIRPAGQLLKQSIGKLIRRGALLRPQKLFEAVDAKLDSREVRRLRNSIGVEQSSIPCCERQLHRRICCKRNFSENQTIFRHHAHAFGRSTPQEQGSVPCARVSQRPLLHVHEQICRRDVLVLELSAQRLIQAGQHLRRIGSVCPLGGKCNLQH